MKIVISFLLSFIFYIFFGLLLLIFHPIQVICKNIWGYSCHKKSVVVLNYLLLKNFWVIGSRIKFTGFEKLPANRPLIIVSNHQSIWDIPPVVWGFRKHHPKFISKIELAYKIPSISYNLRHGGSAIIDRGNSQQSIREVIKLGQRIEQNNYSACIFPEGTRSESGIVRKFQVSGIKTLLKTAPSSLVVPFVIDGNYKFQQKPFPLALGVKLRYSVLDPIEPNHYTAEEVVQKCENAIKSYLNH